MLSRPTSPPEGYPIQGSPPAAGVLETLPHLCDYLCQDSWPDGAPREPSIVLIMAEGGMFKACLSVKETDQTLWTSAEDPRHLLQNLEDCLSSSKPSWRRRKGPKGSSRR